VVSPDEWDSASDHLAVRPIENRIHLLVSVSDRMEKTSKKTKANHPKFSIIIPTFKREKELCQCLDCLQAYFTSKTESGAPSIEVIVSDDANQAELRYLLEQDYPWCRYLCGPARGPAANRNYAASEATGEWIVFTDDDCLPQPGWIEAYEGCSNECDVMEGRTSAVGRRSRLDEECPVNETGGYLWSCNLAVRSDAFKALSGFNEDFPAAAMEDVEFRTRVEKSELRVKFVPTAVVFHPWRQRKGRDFLGTKARSIAFYVSLHPEAARRFSLRAQTIKLIRSIKSSIEFGVTNRVCRGATRQTLLDFYINAVSWIEVKKLKNKRFKQDGGI
jgi:glycosyltransferase involved in cell wall biosynthesis